MKIKSLIGLISVCLLIASFLLPGKLISPAVVSADPGQMEWTWVQTPDSLANVIDSVYSPVDPANPQLGEQGSEIIKFKVGSDGQTVYALVRVGYYHDSDVGNIIIMKSMNGGQTWQTNIQTYLESSYGIPNMPVSVYDLAIAPDNPDMIMVAIAPKPFLAFFSWVEQVWISTDGGGSWANTNWPGVGPTAPTPAVDIISAMDISQYTGNARYLLVGTRNGFGLGTNNIQTMKAPSYGNWIVQDAHNPFNGDVITAKFSPNFNGDSTIAVVYTEQETGTFLVTGVHDVFINSTTWQPAGTHVELKNPDSPFTLSPWEDEIICADIEMPSDFSGQSPSLRRFYVSTAAYTDIAAFDVNQGIYRVDDNVVYTLMDLTNAAFKKIYSISYWGTYASGKLMAGEMYGWACTAQVPVWFTDSPTTCPVPCWYPAKKPPTGAAGCDNCTADMRGWGNAWVEWSPTYADQGVAYASTGFSPFGPWPYDDADPPNHLGLTGDPLVFPDDFGCPAVEEEGLWPEGIIAMPVPLDESAFALTRNNGATWNELSLIDTRIAKLTDVAPSADCSTVFLASTNNETRCRGFDSVWRSSSNENVVAPPLPASPIGSIWERVFCHVTAPTCEDPQSEYAILRLAPDKTDGQVVGWAAGGTSGLNNISKPCGEIFPVGLNTTAVAWSPDYGDFWGNINPRLAVQDMAFQDSTTLHILSLDATAQKLPYTGTAWSSAGATVQCNLAAGHTIEATGAGRLIVGAAWQSSYAAAFSPDGGTNFIPFVQPTGDSPLIGYHAILDTDFETNATVYIGSDANGAAGPAGKVRRNTAPAGVGNPWTDMCRTFTGPFWWTNHRAYYGLVQTNSKNVSGQGTLYAAHRPGVGCGAGDIAGNVIPQPAGCLMPWSGVERTLRPLDGIPKPGIEWCCLDASDSLYRVQNPPVWFTLEPKSLKICGCLTQETDATLYALDNDWYASNHNAVMGIGGIARVRDRGQLWAYTDCVAKVGPVLTMDDGTIIGCDPATGRNQEVNFTWEQLCIAGAYQFVLAKDNAMTQTMISATMSPFQVTSPALVLWAGGEGSSPDFATHFTFGTTPAAGMGKPPSLECGHTFYWMIRVIEVVTQEGTTNLGICDQGATPPFSVWGVPSPWSEIRSFTIKAGFKVSTPYYGVQLLAPDNGCGCACAAPVCFSWSPFKETTGYKFELSENADMSSPLVSTTVTGATAYQYTGTVKCNTNYFWRVMATEPAPSEWSATFSFMTQPEPPPPAPAPAPKPTPIWVWVVIAIGAILVIVTLVLIFKTRRV
jgi:hypothetical protein